MKKKLDRIGDAATQTGLTVKQIRHLEELDLVQPRSVGSHRGYGDTELAVLAALKDLMDRDPAFTPKFIQKVLKLEAFRWQDIPELRRYMELRREAGKEVPETERYRSVLKGALHGEQLLFVADFQSYNSAYKRLRRLADEMGLVVDLRKRDESLFVRARHGRGVRRPRRSSGRTQRTARS